MRRDEDTTGTQPSFATGEGLRHLLQRLATDAGAWQRDPEAPALAEYTVRRYERLCRKWQRDPGEGAAAAFLAMQGEYILRAADPWAVVTVRVRSHVIAESQGERLLVSPDRARQEDLTGYDIPVRAGEHEEYLYDVLTPAVGEPEPSSALLGQIEQVATGLFVCLGWGEQEAATVIEYVLTRLMIALDADRAFHYLRRDDTIPAQLDIPLVVWRQLVRVLVGPRSAPGAPTRRGLVTRIVLELEQGLTVRNTIAEMLDDAELILAIFHARPEAS